MRRLSLPVGCLLGVLTAGADAALADVFISVDKATQRMAVLVDGERQHFWPVSTGLAHYDTPTGSYTPFRLAKDHFSKEWDDAPMPHSIFFTSRGHAIHGSDATRRLGSPASHGCIRLSRENAAILFNLVKEQGLENTRIAVIGEEATATVIAGKKDQVQGAARKPVAVAGKKDRVQIAERESRKPRVAARRVPRDQLWAGGTRRWVVQYQNPQPQPQPFWSPFAYGAPTYSYGWR